MTVANKPLTKALNLHICTQDEGLVDRPVYRDSDVIELEFVECSHYYYRSF